MPNLRCISGAFLGVAGACALVVAGDAVAAEPTAADSLAGAAYDSCRLFVGSADAGSVRPSSLERGDQQLGVELALSGDPAVRAWIKGSMEGRRPLKEVRVACADHGKPAFAYSLHNAFVTKVEMRIGSGEALETQRLTIRYQSLKLTVAKA